MKKLNVVGAAAVAAGLLALAGCNNRSPEQPPAPDNGVVSETNVTTESNVAVPVAKPSSATSNATAAVDLRPAPAAPDSQTQDDADATGMTSRVHRGDAPSNETTAP